MYPNPELVIVVPVITPFVIVAVAVAVVPIPTPIPAVGIPTERLVEAPTYPIPPSTIVNPDN